MSKTGVPNDWLSEAFSKMRPWHAFIAVVVISFMLFVLPPYFSYLSAKESREVAQLTFEKVEGMYSLVGDNVNILGDIAMNVGILRNGNENNLSLHSATFIISSVLTAAETNIIADVQAILYRNTIHDSLRQVLIRDALTVRVKSYYSSDHAAMSRFYYHSTQLSEVWDHINPDDFIDGVCGIMFDVGHYPNDDNHTILERDLTMWIENKFNNYRSMSERILNTM